MGEERKEGCPTCGTGSSAPGGVCPAPPRPGAGCPCETPEKPECPEEEIEGEEIEDACPDDKTTVYACRVTPYMYCKLREGNDPRPYVKPKRICRHCRREVEGDSHCIGCGECYDKTHEGAWCPRCGTPLTEDECHTCEEEEEEPSPAGGCGTGLPCRRRQGTTAAREQDGSLSELRHLALLSYLKPPVRTVEELYDRYPEGGEWGWFAFVTDKETFAYWHARERSWQLISNDAPEQLLALRDARFRDGDSFYWDARRGRFVVRQPDVYGIEMY